MRIAITASAFDVGNLPPSLAACDLVVNNSGRRLDRDGVLALVGPEVDGAIAGLEPFDATVLARASSLRAVSRIGTGVDNVDLAAAAERGVQVLRTPDAPTSAVAELTVAFILAGLRDLLHHHAQVVGGAWKGRPAGLLEGRTVSLVGAGRIARAVASRLVPFGVAVQAADPYVAAGDVPFPLVDLDTLLTTSHIVSLHVPGQDAPEPLLDARRLALLPDGAMLINTARGGLVDEAALAAALRSRRLAFAALDAYATEPYQGELRDLDNVLLTPHVGSNTHETRLTMEREAARNLAVALGLPV